jgi:hypothetical protein
MMSRGGCDGSSAAGPGSGDDVLRGGEERGHLRQGRHAIDGRDDLG